MKTNFTKFLGLLFILIFAFVLPVSAKTTFDVELKGSTAPEVKLFGSVQHQIPLLQGESLLTQNNNLKVKTTIGISPVSATIDLKTVFTPIAVAEINLGASVGTGWNLGDSLSGSLIKKPATAVDTDLFGKLFTKGVAGAALQFDTAALFDNKWLSIFSRIYQEVSYQSFQNSKGALWNFESSGFRENGGFYHAEYIVGYNMPIVLNTVALMFETDINNIFSKDYQSPLLLTFSAITNFKVLDNLNITVVTQFTDKENKDNKETQKGTFGYSKVAAIVKYVF